MDRLRGNWWLFEGGRFIPANNLQIEHTDGIHDGHQQESDYRGGAEASDLRVTHRFPERAAVDGERDQSHHGGADGNEHRAQAHDAGVENRFFEGLALRVFLLDEIEEHDDVTDDD